MNDFFQKNKVIILTTLAFNVFFFLVVLFLFSFVLGRPLFGPEQQTDLSDVYIPQSAEEAQVIRTVEEANPAVVSIVATAELPGLSPQEREFLRFFAPFLDIPEGAQGGTEREVGGGSGFLVSPDGLIVTNRHVVDNEEAEYTAVTSDGDQYSAVVVAKDPAYDIAILDIDVQGAEYLEFGDSDEIRLGQTVVAIGNALAQFSHSISEGIVSGLYRSVTATDASGQSERLEGVIQTDAAINFGNSGGPLLNLEGDVVGVNVAVAVGSENIGFALPSNIVQEIVESVQESGEIIRPYVGIWYREITPDIAEAENLPVDHGVLVVENQMNSGVVEGSPAEDAGIEGGDIILAINGEEIDTDTIFSAEIREYDVGDTITLTVLRDGVERNIEVILERAPDAI